MNYHDFKKKILAEDPEVREEYERLGPQYEAIRAAIASRKEAGMTQKELAEKMGTAQAGCSRKKQRPLRRKPGWSWWITLPGKN